MRDATAHPVARRAVLSAAAAGLTGTALVGCDLLSTTPEGGSATKEPEQDPDAKEARDLADLVRVGKLPPVSERLPKSPAVVRPTDRPGQYGGQWRNALLGVGDAFRLAYSLGYENLVRWNLAWDEVIPNVAEEFEVNADGTVFTFQLRPGLKWSDGEPFTADDIEFAYNDVLLNPDVSPIPPAEFVTDRPATLKKLDSQTVEFRFSTPNGLLAEELASDPSGVLTRMPVHYLKAFHADHADDADHTAKDAGYTDWIEAMQDYASNTGALWQDVDLPRLHAWLPTAGLGDETGRMEFERNPYYWKTDPDGRQLPYLDGISFEMANDAEALVLMVAQGELDLIDRHVNTTENKPILARDREAGGYDFFDLIPEKVNTMTILLNLTCPDEVKREIFRKVDFRIGLSHAINREEIITAVHARQGEPWQIAPQKGTDFYDEEMAKQYTEYNVDLANEHLDRAGFSERDGDGYRLGPDGQRIRFSIDLSLGAGKPHLAEGLELVRDYWGEVGIDMRINSIDATLFEERRSSNQADGMVWDGDGGIDVILAPGAYVPDGGHTGSYAPGWAVWHSTDGAEGDQPPAATRRQFELYDQLKTLVDSDERLSVMKEILAIAKEQFYAIGISTPVPGYGVVQNTFHNMIDETFFAANFPYPGVTYPEQYFIEADE